MVKIKLTPKQIVEIYNAGRNRGGHEEAAYDRGCSPSGKTYDDLEDVMSWGDAILSSKEVRYDDKFLEWEHFKREAGIN